MRQGALILAAGNKTSNKLYILLIVSDTINNRYVHTYGDHLNTYLPDIYLYIRENRFVVFSMNIVFDRYFE